MISQHRPGHSNWSAKWVNFFLVRGCTFFGIPAGLVSLKYHVVRRYNISKTSVLFTYQLWRLCDVLSWSVSLINQLVRLYDVSNWLVLSRYQCDVGKTSEIGPSYSRTNCDVMMTSQHGPQHLDLYETYLRRRYNVACQMGFDITS